MAPAKPQLQLQLTKKLACDHKKDAQDFMSFIDECRVVTLDARTVSKEYKETRPLAESQETRNVESQAIDMHLQQIDDQYHQVRNSLEDLMQLMEKVETQNEIVQRVIASRRQKISQGDILRTIEMAFSVVDEACEGTLPAPVQTREKPFRFIERIQEQSKNDTHHDCNLYKPQTPTESDTICRFMEAPKEKVDNGFHASRFWRNLRKLHERSGAREELYQKTEVELASAKMALEKTQREHHACQESDHAIQRKLDQATKDLAASHRSLSKAEEEILKADEAHKSNQESLQTRIIALEDQRTKDLETIKSLRGKTEKSGTRLTKVESLRKEAERTREEATAERGEATPKVEALQGSKCSMQNAHDALVLEKTNLNVQLGKANEDEATRRRFRNRWSKGMAHPIDGRRRLESQIQGSQQRHADAETLHGGAVHGSQARLEVAEDRTADLEIQVADCNERASDAETQLRSLDSATEEIISLKITNGNFVDTVHTLESQLQEARTSWDDVRFQNSVLEADANDRESDAKAQVRLLNSATEAGNTIETVNGNLVDTGHTLELHSQEAQTSCADIKLDNNVLEADAIDADRQLSATKNSLTCLRAQHEQTEKDSRGRVESSEGKIQHANEMRDRDAD